MAIRKNETLVTQGGVWNFRNMNKLKQFLIKSYYDNKMAFYYEMASTIRLIIASSIQLVTVLEQSLILCSWLLDRTYTRFIGAYYRQSTWVMIHMYLVYCN